MKTIRIESDGTPGGTKVFNYKNQLIEGITKLDVKFRPGKLVEATITFTKVEFNSKCEPLFITEKIIYNVKLWFKVPR